MKRMPSKLALAFSLAIACCMLLAADRVEAQVPQYYTLRAPAPAPALHAGGHGYYPGQAQPVARHAYAYGYFGVKPRRHWSRHTGYYREYTQWSAR